MAASSQTAARAVHSRLVPTILRATREFAAVPLAVIAVFVGFAALAILGDQSAIPGSATLRHGLEHVIGKDAASTTLQAVATGLVTVTSITFSVLLLAVQQTASNLSPVVFDQFVRRRANQAFLGFFVGLALFAYLVMAGVQNGTPPIIGAFVATVLTVVAMVFLLALIYTTIDQMRPANVLRQIHDRVLSARDREAALVRRTRRSVSSHDPVRATYCSKSTGYVTSIDLDRLARALQQVPSAQIELHVALGDFVAFGRAVASVYDDDEADARAIADEVRDAILISDQRDLDQDASTGIDEIANIGWTAGSTAKQSPEIARQAMHSLADIAARWLAHDPAATRPGDDPLPIVYPDRDLERIFEILYSLVVVTYESRQHMQAARLLDTYRQLLDSAADGPWRRRVERDLEMLGPLLDKVPESPVLDAARARVTERVAAND